jgi:hypothetical protein
VANEDVSAILDQAAQTLGTAQLGLKDIASDDPERRAAGIRNVLVFGRAVTNVLQRLRSHVDGFDEWYAPWQTEMAGDPLLRYLYKLRSDVLKRGVLPTSTGLHIKHFHTGQIPPPPPGAKSFFMGDQLGGSGWEVELPDGTIEKRYIAVPPEIAESWLTFPDAPDDHLGQPVNDKSPGHICSLYIDYLKRLLADARSSFAE